MMRQQSEADPMKRILLAVAFVTASAALAMVQSRPEPAMAAAAKALIAALDEGQRAKIQFPMDSEERFNWHFIPRDRQGLPLKSMTPAQRDVAFALLKTGLSEKGFTKAETIRSLEVILKALENGAARRDTELYYFTIFGEPGGDKWGWRYEGHHIAQNWTVVRGKPASTSPAFFGTNPAVVQDGPTKGQRALPLEGDLAFQLLASLTDEQRRQAVVSEKAPNDIITSNTRKAAIADNVGLASSAMTVSQREILTRLIEEHAGAQAAALSAGRIAKVKADGPANVRFAWMGATQPGLGNPHYYRIQGKSFLIEYDNVQNNANHQHVAWRDFNGDFGEDLLSQHYSKDPAHAGAAQVQPSPARRP
jgi:hypothetical protein